MASEWEKENKKLQEQIKQVQDQIARQRELIRTQVSDNAAKGEELGKLYIKRNEIKKNANAGGGLQKTVNQEE